MFAAIRRAPSLMSNLAADRRRSEVPSSLGWRCSPDCLPHDVATTAMVAHRWPSSIGRSTIRSLFISFAAYPDAVETAEPVRLAIGGPGPLPVLRTLRGCRSSACALVCRWPPRHQANGWRCLTDELRPASFLRVDHQPHGRFQPQPPPHPGAALKKGRQGRFQPQPPQPPPQPQPGAALTRGRFQPQAPEPPPQPP
jgi:hypothetical protein